MIRWVLALSFIILLLLAACQPANTPGEEKYILASTTFIADITRNIAGDRLKVETLLPPGVDPHSYQPVPADVARIAKSALLVINGADYEHFIEALIENAGGDHIIIEASSGLDSRPGSEHGVDPHFWLDPVNVIRYVENIRDGLIAADPSSQGAYSTNAEAYISELNELHAWVSAQVEQVPLERRLLVTNHESLGYFADRYGFTIVGAVVPGLSSNAAPSARQMSSLVNLIRSSGAPTIFLDSSDNPGLATQIAAETGVIVVGDLHIEALTGQDGNAPSYILMIQHNVNRIVESLK